MTCNATPPAHVWAVYKFGSERWVNLWGKAEWVGSAIPGDCEADGVGLFAWNFEFVAGCLLGIFLVHMAVVSAVEALWVTKVS